MAIVRHYHKPNLSITMTCNPNWSEIKDNLLPGQTPQDIPHLTKSEIFGLPGDHLWVIEFQKRGIPYDHNLLY